MASFEAIKKELEDPYKESEVIKTEDNKTAVHDQVLRIDQKAATLWNLDNFYPNTYTRTVTRRKAIELYRVFVRASRSERRSRDFIEIARAQLTLLHLYNDSVLTQKKRYPRTKWMFHLLCRYVALEFESLGPNPDPNKCDDEVQDLVRALISILSNYFEVDSEIRGKVFIVHIIIAAYHTYKFPEWYMEALAGLVLKGTIIQKQLNEVYSGDDDLLCVSDMWFNNGLKYLMEMDDFGTDDEDSDTSDQEDSKDFLESMHRKTRRKEEQVNHKTRLKTSTKVEELQDNDDVIFVKDENASSDCDSMKQFHHNFPLRFDKEKDIKHESGTIKKSTNNNSSGNKHNTKSPGKPSICITIIDDDDDEVAHKSDFKSENVDSDVEVIDSEESPAQVRIGRVTNRRLDRRKRRTRPKPIYVVDDDDEPNLGSDNSRSNKHTSIAQTSGLINSLEISTTSSDAEDTAKYTSLNQLTSTSKETNSDQISSTVVIQRKCTNSSRRDEDTIVTSTKHKKCFGINENDDFLKELQELALLASDAKLNSRIAINSNSLTRVTTPSSVLVDTLSSTSSIEMKTTCETASKLELEEISSTAMEINRSTCMKNSSTSSNELQINSSFDQASNRPSTSTSALANTLTSTSAKASEALITVGSPVRKLDALHSTASSQFPEVSSTQNIASEEENILLETVDSQIGQSNIQFDGDTIQSFEAQTRDIAITMIEPSVETDGVIIEDFVDALIAKKKTCRVDQAYVIKSLIVDQKILHSEQTNVIKEKFEIGHSEIESSAMIQQEVPKEIKISNKEDEPQKEVNTKINEDDIKKHDKDEHVSTMIAQQDNLVIAEQNKHPNWLTNQELSAAEKSLVLEETLSMLPSFKTQEEFPEKSDQNCAIVQNSSTMEIPSNDLKTVEVQEIHLQRTDTSTGMEKINSLKSQGLKKYSEVSDYEASSSNLPNSTDVKMKISNEAQNSQQDIPCKDTKVQEKQFKEGIPRKNAEICKKFEGNKLDTGAIKPQGFMSTEDGQINNSTTMRRGMPEELQGVSSYHTDDSKSFSNPEAIKNKSSDLVNESRNNEGKSEDQDSEFEKKSEDIQGVNDHKKRLNNLEKTILLIESIPTINAEIKESVECNNKEFNSVDDECKVNEKKYSVVIDAESKSEEQKCMDAIIPTPLQLKAALPGESKNENSNPLLKDEETTKLEIEISEKIKEPSNESSSENSNSLLEVEGTTKLEIENSEETKQPSNENSKPLLEDEETTKLQIENSVEMKEPSHGSSTENSKPQLKDAKTTKPEFENSGEKKEPSNENSKPQLKDEETKHEIENSGETNKEPLNENSIPRLEDEETTKPEIEKSEEMKEPSNEKSKPQLKDEETKHEIENSGETNKEPLNENSIPRLEDEETTKPEIEKSEEMKEPSNEKSKPQLKDEETKHEIENSEETKEPLNENSIPQLEDEETTKPEIENSEEMKEPSNENSKPQLKDEETKHEIENSEETNKEPLNELNETSIPQLEDEETTKPEIENSEEMKEPSNVSTNENSKPLPKYEETAKLEIEISEKTKEPSFENSKSQLEDEETTKPQIENSEEMKEPSNVSSNENCTTTQLKDLVFTEDQVEDNKLKIHEKFEESTIKEYQEFSKKTCNDLEPRAQEESEKFVMPVQNSEKYQSDTPKLHDVIHTEVAVSKSVTQNEELSKGNEPTEDSGKVDKFPELSENSGIGDALQNESQQVDVSKSVTQNGELSKDNVATEKSGKVQDEEDKNNHELSAQHYENSSVGELQMIYLLNKNKQEEMSRDLETSSMEELKKSMTSIQPVQSADKINEENDLDATQIQESLQSSNQVNKSEIMISEELTGGSDLIEDKRLSDVNNQDLVEQKTPDYSKIGKSSNENLQVNKNDKKEMTNNLVKESEMSIISSRPAEIINPENKLDTTQPQEFTEEYRINDSKNFHCESSHRSDGGTQRIGEPEVIKNLIDESRKTEDDKLEVINNQKLTEQTMSVNSIIEIGDLQVDDQKELSNDFESEVPQKISIRLAESAEKELDTTQAEDFIKTEDSKAFESDFHCESSQLTDDTQTINKPEVIENVESSKFEVSQEIEGGNNNQESTEYHSKIEDLQEVNVLKKDDQKEIPNEVHSMEESKKIQVAEDKLDSINTEASKTCECDLSQALQSESSHLTDDSRSISKPEATENAALSTGSDLIEEFRKVDAVNNEEIIAVSINSKNSEKTLIQTQVAENKLDSINTEASKTCENDLSQALQSELLNLPDHSRSISKPEAIQKAALSTGSVLIEESTKVDVINNQELIAVTVNSKIENSNDHHSISLISKSENCNNEDSYVNNLLSKNGQKEISNSNYLKCPPVKELDASKISSNLLESAITAKNLEENKQEDFFDTKELDINNSHKTQVLQSNSSILEATENKEISKDFHLIEEPGKIEKTGSSGSVGKLEATENEEISKNSHLIEEPGKMEQTGSSKSVCKLEAISKNSHIILKTVCQLETTENEERSKDYKLIEEPKKIDNSINNQEQCTSVRFEIENKDGEDPQMINLLSKDDPKKISNDLKSRQLEESEKSKTSTQLVESVVTEPLNQINDSKIFEPPHQTDGYKSSSKPKALQKESSDLNKNFSKIEGDKLKDNNHQENSINIGSAVSSSSKESKTDSEKIKSHNLQKTDVNGDKKSSRSSKEMEKYSSLKSHKISGDKNKSSRSSRSKDGSNISRYEKSRSDSPKAKDDPAKKINNKLVKDNCDGQDKKKELFVVLKKEREDVLKTTNETVEQKLKQGRKQNSANVGKPPSKQKPNQKDEDCNKFPCTESRAVETIIAGENKLELDTGETTNYNVEEETEKNKSNTLEDVLPHKINLSKDGKRKTDEVAAVQPHKRKKVEDQETLSKGDLGAPSSQDAKKENCSSFKTGEKSNKEKRRKLKKRDGNTSLNTELRVGETVKSNKESSGGGKKKIKDLVTEKIKTINNIKEEINTKASEKFLQNKNKSNLDDKEVKLQIMEEVQSCNGEKVKEAKKYQETSQDVNEKHMAIGKNEKNEGNSTSSSTKSKMVIADFRECEKKEVMELITGETTRKVVDVKQETALEENLLHIADLDVKKTQSSKGNKVADAMEKEINSSVKSNEKINKGKHAEQTLKPSSSKSNFTSDLHEKLKSDKGESTIKIKDVKEKVQCKALKEIVTNKNNLCRKMEKAELKPVKDDSTIKLKNVEEEVILPNKNNSDVDGTRKLKIVEEVQSHKRKRVEDEEMINKRLQVQSSQDIKLTSKLKKINSSDKSNEKKIKEKQVDISKNQKNEDKFSTITDEDLHELEDSEKFKPVTAETTISNDEVQCEVVQDNSNLGLDDKKENHELIIVQSYTAKRIEDIIVSEVEDVKLEKEIQSSAVEEVELLKQNEVKEVQSVGEDKKKEINAIDKTKTEDILSKSDNELFKNKIEDTFITSAKNGCYNQHKFQKNCVNEEKNNLNDVTDKKKYAKEAGKELPNDLRTEVGVGYLNDTSKISNIKKAASIAQCAGIIADAFEISYPEKFEENVIAFSKAAEPLAKQECALNNISVNAAINDDKTAFIITTDDLVLSSKSNISIESTVGNCTPIKELQLKSLNTQPAVMEEISLKKNVEDEKEDLGEVLPVLGMKRVACAKTEFLVIPNVLENNTSVSFTKGTINVVDDSANIIKNASVNPSTKNDFTINKAIENVQSKSIQTNIAEENKEKMMEIINQQNNSISAISTNPPVVKFGTIKKRENEISSIDEKVPAENQIDSSLVVEDLHSGGFKNLQTPNQTHLVLEDLRTLNQTYLALDLQEIKDNVAVEDVTVKSSKNLREMLEYVVEDLQILNQTNLAIQGIINTKESFKKRTLKKTVGEQEVFTVKKQPSVDITKSNIEGEAKIAKTKNKPKRVHTRERPKTFEEIMNSLRDSDRISDPTRLIQSPKIKDDKFEFKLTNTITEENKTNGEEVVKMIIQDFNEESECRKQPNVIVEHIPQFYAVPLELPSVNTPLVITTPEKIPQPVLPIVTKILENKDATSICADSTVIDLNVGKQSDTPPVDVDERPLSEKVKELGSWVTNAISETQSAVGDPVFLSVSINKDDNKLEGIQEGLEYTLDDNDIFLFSEQICNLGNNLPAVENTSLTNSPVDIITDYQFSDQDTPLNFFIENHLTEDVYLIDTNTSQNMFIPNICKEETIEPEEEPVDDFSDDRQIRGQFNQPPVFSLESMKDIFDSPVPDVDTAQTRTSGKDSELVNIQDKTLSVLGLQDKTQEHLFPLTNISLADMDHVNYNEQGPFTSNQLTNSNSSEPTNSKAPQNYNENILQTPRIIPAALENSFIPELSQTGTESTQTDNAQIEEINTPTKLPNKKQAKSSPVGKVNLVDIKKLKPECDENDENKWYVRSSVRTKVCAPKRKSSDSPKQETDAKVGVTDSKQNVRKRLLSPTKPEVEKKQNVKRLKGSRDNDEDCEPKHSQPPEQLSNLFDNIREMDPNRLPNLNSVTAPGNSRKILSKNSDKTRKPYSLTKVEKNENEKRSRIFNDDDEDFEVKPKNPIQTAEQLSNLFDSVKKMDPNTLPLLNSVTAPGNSREISVNNPSNVRKSYSFTKEPPHKKNKQHINPDKVDNSVKKELKKKPRQKEYSIVPEQEVRWHTRSSSLAGKLTADASHHSKSNPDKHKQYSQTIISREHTSSSKSSRRITTLDNRYQYDQERGMKTRSQYNSSRYSDNLNNIVDSSSYYNSTHNYGNKYYRTN